MFQEHTPIRRQTQNQWVSVGHVKHLPSTHNAFLLLIDEDFVFSGFYVIFYESGFRLNMRSLNVWISTFT